MRYQSYFFIDSFKITVDPPSYVCLFANRFVKQSGSKASTVLRGKQTEYENIGSLDELTINYLWVQNRR